MKAKVVKIPCSVNSGEYFAIKLEGVKLQHETLKGLEVILRFPASHYDWMEDPEAIISEIAKKINS